MVDLETQKGEPTADERWRVVGNMARRTASAPPDMVGRRHRQPRADGLQRRTEGLALPQWTIAKAPHSRRVWRYPLE